MNSDTAFSPEKRSYCKESKLQRSRLVNESTEVYVMNIRVFISVITLSESAVHILKRLNRRINNLIMKQVIFQSQAIQYVFY